MRNKFAEKVILLFGVCLLLGGCQKNSEQPPTQTVNPNASVTYEKGRDFVGVIKASDTEAKAMTFYNTASEEELVYTYTSGTQVLTKNEKQISSESLEVGQVLDVYLNPDTGQISKLQISKDIVEYESVKKLAVNVDEKYMEVNGVRYRYGSGFTAFSNGEPVDIQEIVRTDEVTFRGVKGKAYSLIVTRGHGYIRPEKYKDFIGGTMTIQGVTVLPITENMLVPVPEGIYEVSMKNGDYSGSRSVKVERDKQMLLDMSLFKITDPNTGQVIFEIDPIGAELYVNGTMTDYSRPVSLKYGKHSISVVLDGYTTYVGVVDVRSANPTVHISLADEEAEVSDNSDKTSVSDDNNSEENKVSENYDNLHKIAVNTPVGASVYMDGIYKGIAPCSFAKKIGNITITLSKDGFTTKSYTVETTDDSQDVQWSFPDLVSQS